MTETPDRTDSIFAAAVVLASAQERAAYLDQACAGDAALRGHVEALLRAHERAGHLLDRPVPGGLKQTGEYIPREQAGTVIAGRYKLLEEIGEGGMGTVWVAEQTQPVRRKVALKLIKPGMDSKSVLARFEAERQALAVMDHANIAKVLDGGLTETGRPFFVMEYVKGVPITEYCDATRLSVSERLTLFVQVCQAVQHAHQKGIIHRDLKPSNILVAPYDDTPVPKVIDFGLAKAMHQSLTELTLHTAHESVLGTPLYMSPEQAQLNNLDVDTRSDIYSLGVLLYELLTGTTPVERKRFKEAAWGEIKRIIREEEPPRPSTRLSSSRALPALAAGRQTEPARLTKLVRGELDWIVMKSLEKDRVRRYETANGFAFDIQRYLAGEPVLAAPPSARYRLRKFARKHRAALTTAAALTLLLVAGVAVSTWQAIRATRAEATARSAEQDALQAQRIATERAEGERLAKLAAQEQKTQAEAARDNEARERAYAEAIAKFVKNDFLALTSVEGQGRFDGKELTRNATLRELLDRAAEKLKTRQNLAPRTEAELCWIIGVSYRGVGEFARAIPFLERSVGLYRQASGPEAAATLNAQNSLGVAYGRAGQYDRAVTLHEETLRLQKAKLGPEHPDTLTSMDNLAAAYWACRKLDLAVPLFEETLKLSKAKRGPEHPDTLISMNNLASAYLNARKLDLALPLFEQALNLRKAKLGPEHPDTLQSMNNLASAYQAAGKLALALPLFEQALKLSKAKLGPEHPDTLRSMHNLAGAYQDARKLDLALPLFEETLNLRKAKLGPEHPDTLHSMNNLASAYRAAGKVDLALPLFEEGLKLSEAKLGPEHPDTLTNMANLAAAYWSAKQLDKSIPLFEETLKRYEEKLGRDHPDTLSIVVNLAVNYTAAGRLKEAIPLLEGSGRGHRARSAAVPGGGSPKASRAGARPAPGAVTGPDLPPVRAAAARPRRKAPAPGPLRARSPVPIGRCSGPDPPTRAAPAPGPLRARAPVQIGRSGYLAQGERGHRPASSGLGHRSGTGAVPGDGSPKASVAGAWPLRSRSPELPPGRAAAARPRRAGPAPGPLRARSPAPFRRQVSGAGRRRNRSRARPEPSGGGGGAAAGATIEHRLGKVNTFHFLRALSYIALILAGVSTDDHGKCA